MQGSVVSTNNDFMHFVRVVAYAYVAAGDDITSRGRVGDDLDAELRHGLQEPESL